MSNSRYKLWLPFLGLALVFVMIQLSPEKARAYAPELKWQEVHVPGVTYINMDEVVWVGNQFIAIGDDGRVMTSPDGIVWTRQTSTTTQDLNDIVYANGRFVAVGYGGAVITSTNGVDWTGQTLHSQYGDEPLNAGMQYYLRDVVWDGARFVVKSSYSSIFVSTDLVTWSESQIPRGNEMIYTSNGWYMVGSTGGLDPHASIKRSADGGTTWTTVFEAEPGVLHSLLYANGRFVASGLSAENGTFVFRGLIVTSVDGVNWSSQLLPGALYPKNIQWVNNEFILSAARTSSNQSTLFYSTDGQIWTEHASGFGKGSIHSVAYGPGYYVAVGFNYDTPAFYRSVLAPLSNLSAMGATASQATLEWGQPANAGNVRLEYKQSSTNIANWTEAATTTAVTASSAGATVTGLLPGTGYDFRLLVTGGANEGYSNVAQATTEPVPIDNLTIASTSSIEVGLSWSAAPFASSIAVQQSTDNGNSWTAASTSAYVPPSATGATVRNLTPGTAYMFRVVVAGGQKAGASNEVSATTPYLQVTNLSSNPYTGSTPTTVTLTWTAATNAAAVVLEQSADGLDGWTAATVSGGAISPDAATATVTGLTPTTTYYYRLSITGGYHHGYSNAVAATTKAALITDLAATPNKKVATFTWTPVSDATSAVLEYRNSSNGMWYPFDWSTDIDLSTGTYTTEENDLSLYVNHYVRLNVTGGHSAGTSNPIYTMLLYLDVDFQNTSYSSRSASFQWPEYFDSATMATIFQQRSITYKLSSSSTWIDGTASWNALTGTISGLTPNASYDFALLAKYGASRLMSDVVTLTTRPVYALGYATDGNGSITGEASQSVDYDGNGTTVTAVPASGYTFLQWSDGLDTASRTDTNVRGNLDVTAQFVADTVNVVYEYNDGEAPMVVQRSFNSLLTEPDRPTREGHLFIGWYSDSALTQAWDFDTDTVPMGGVTLYARWVVAYGVTFADWNGTTLATELVQQGTAASAPPDPSRIGHTFAGWDKSFDAVAESMTVIAVYTVNTYTVAFDSLGGSSIAAIEANFNTIIAAPNEPLLDDHQFDGWFADTALTQAWDFTLDRVPVDGMTLYAKWIETYPVVFVDWDGAVLRSVVVGRHKTATAPASPLRPGYTFASWSVPFHDVTEALTVQAVYSVNDYDVGYIYNDGSSITVVQATYGDKLAAPQLPTRDGYLFVGWYSDLELSLPWDFGTDTVPIDGVTLYAAWVETYPVTFVDWNGSVLQSEIVTRHDGAVAPADPTRPGHTFAGWNLSFSDVTTALTIQALYTVNSYQASYVYNDGSPITVVQATYGEPLVAPQLPTRGGYLFVDWHKNAELTEAWDFTLDRLPLDGITLYARWAVAHSVAFVDWNGTQLKVDIVKQGEAAAPPANPTRSGYTFVGWDGSFSAVAAEQTITALYAVNAYTVYFDSGGGTEIDSLTADYGEKIDAPQPPTRTGYRFVGWYKEAALTHVWSFHADTVPVNGMTLHARWSRLAQPLGPTEGSSAEKTEDEQTVSGHEVLINGSPQPLGIVMEKDEGGKREALVTVNEEQLLRRLAEEGDGTVVTITFPGPVAVLSGELTGQIVKALEQHRSVVEFATDQGTYKLPARSLNIDAIVREFGSDIPLQDIIVRIEIAEPTTQTRMQIEQLAQNGDMTFVGSPVQFAVKAIYGERTLDINPFAAYVERLIPLPEHLGADHVTTGVVVEPDGTLRHVPTKILIVDGKTIAHINSLTNSTYTLVWKPASFSDMDQHWAEAAVNDMGSRLIVSGMGDGRFAPDLAVTRAEFTAILVRALGLGAVDGNTSYLDVRPDDWFAGSIATARAYGLIDGYEDGTFRPHQLVTREQAMVVMARAMKWTGPSEQLTEGGGAYALQRFSDAGSLSQWARPGAIDSVRAGLIAGRGAGLLAPQEAMTRAEIAAVVRKLLQQSELI